MPIGSICEPDLGPFIMQVLDSLAVDGSYVLLDSPVVPFSLRVSWADQILPRSATAGFDYYPAERHLVFTDPALDLSTPSELVVSYHRWTAP